MTLADSLARHEVLRFLHRWHRELDDRLHDGTALEEEIRAFKLIAKTLKEVWSGRETARDQTRPDALLLLRTPHESHRLSLCGGSQKRNGSNGSRRLTAITPKQNVARDEFPGKLLATGRTSLVESCRGCFGLMAISYEEPQPSHGC
jgi:hypothetical protein